jgi:glycosyltransferase involved in cell wall biosynthesis
MSDPQISVVIPAYNEEKFLRDCLLSVKKQHVSVPYEIIVVNNNSTDATAKIAREEGVRVFDEPEKGLAFARQKGLDAAKGELLVYLDADVRLPAGWLEKIYTYFQKNPRVSAISCDFRFYDGRVLETIGQRFFDGIIMPLNNAVMRLVDKPEVLIGQSIALRTESLRKAGGINLDFVFHGEDTSLAYRMHSQGKVKFLSDIFVYSSARRYQRDGLFETLYAYWTTYWYFTLGRYKKAVRFAREHNPN